MLLIFGDENDIIKLLTINKCKFECHKMLHTKKILQFPLGKNKCFDSKCFTVLNFDTRGKKQ